MTTFYELIAKRERLLNNLEKVNLQMEDIAARYSGPIPCGGYIGEFESITREGFLFAHDCFDHGYDVHVRTTWVLPLPYGEFDTPVRKDFR